MTAFEDGLWERLVRENDADGVTLHTAAVSNGARRPLLIGGGVTALMATAAVVIVAVTTGSMAPPAYALTKHSDGSITVTIHDVETAIPELNARFRAMGIAETVVPVTSTCRTNKGSSALFQDPMFADPLATTSETVTLDPGRKHLLPGFDGVMAAEQLPNGEVAIAVEAVKPPVPSCFPTTAYTVHDNGTTTNGTPSFQVTPLTATATTTSGPSSSQPASTSSTPQPLG